MPFAKLFSGLLIATAHAFVEDSKESSIREAFNTKHAEYRKKSHAEFLGDIESLFIGMCKTFTINGFMIAGQTDTTQFISVKTKVGLFMMYVENNVVHYRCEEEYAAASSAKHAGFGSTSGVIDTIEKLNHMFKVFDSYF